MSSVLLEGVSVEFPIYGAERSFRKVLFERATGGFVQREGRKLDRVVVKSLTDISLHLSDGDRLGLVGHNGAGKSTLLRVMAGAYAPVKGRITVEGKITPLFDVLPGLDGEDRGHPSGSGDIRRRPELRERLLLDGVGVGEVLDELVACGSVAHGVLRIRCEVAGPRGRWRQPPRRLLRGRHRE